ncbi:MAG TPA: hypothetical protein VK205_09130 [Prolixibacteraceae bacterium]|nr:hypothetical protein [Prolixibacteraceae bacterium]
MKKIVLLIAIVIISSIGLTASAQYGRRNVSKVTSKEKAAPAKENKGEKVFLANADKALSVIEEEAHKISINGTAVVAFVPGEKTQTWTSKMKVIGFFTNNDSNTLGVAYTKMAEMADLLRDSGSGARKPLTGEYGWQGGAIKKVEGGYLLAAFSGASGEQDYAVASAGLNWLAQQYSK